MTENQHIDEKLFKFTKNAAKCLECGDVIESKSKKDLRKCSCYDDNHGIFVDGGLYCPRHGFTTVENYRDLCEWVQ